MVRHDHIEPVGERVVELQEVGGAGVVVQHQDRPAAPAAADAELRLAERDLLLVPTRRHRHSSPKLIISLASYSAARQPPTAPSPYALRATPCTFVWKSRGRAPMQRSATGAGRILTTHTGSLPRPPELTRLYVRRARGEAIDPAELDRLGKAALRHVVDKQIEAGIDIGNNGEQQREAFFLYVRHRMSGFGGSWQRYPRGDVQRYPILKEQMRQASAAREAVSNMDPPKATGEVRYIDDSELRQELSDFQTVLNERPDGFVAPF